MTNRFDRYDSAYYRSLLDQLVADFSWVHVDGAPSLDAAAERAADDSPSVAEVQLSHLYTDATMYLRLPDYANGNAAQAIVYHSLDPQIPDSDEGFIGSLGRSHERIADTYESEYVEPVADPNVVLCGNVPVDYTEQKLYSMMTAVSATVFRIQRLHEDVRSPLCAVLSSDPSCSNGSPDSDCRISIGG